MSAAIDPTTFNPNDPAYIQDPYPTLAWFRENMPIAPISLVPPAVYPGSTVPFVPWVFRDADVRSVLEATDVWCKQVPLNTSKGAPVPPVFGTTSALPPGLLGSDPPRHDTMRAIFQPAFDALADGIEATVQQQVDAALSGIASTRRFELVTQYGIPVPARTLLDLLGLPERDYPLVQPWAESMATAHNITMPRNLLILGGTIALAMHTYIDALVTAESASPTSGPGLLGAVAGDIGKGLELHDVQAVMTDMVVAGYITTTYLICSGLMRLFQNPDQLAKLQADPSLMPGAVSEMLRYDPPAQMLDRTASQDTELGGRVFHRGDPVVLCLNSANRDSAVYANADDFDITRTETSQLGFGDGIHRCIGEPLARRVVPIALQGLLSLPNLRIDGIAQWQPDPYLRGMVSLPMAYGA